MFLCDSCDIITAPGVVIRTYYITSDETLSFFCEIHVTSSQLQIHWVRMMMTTHTMGVPFFSGKRVLVQKNVVRIVILMAKN